MAITLANLEQMAVTRITREYAASNVAYPSAMLYLWFSDAYREIQKKCHLLIATDRQNLVAGQANYTRPTDLLGDLIIDNGLMVKDAAGETRFPERRTWEYLRSQYGDFTGTDSRGVADWGMQGATIYLLWPPEDSITNGLVIDYVTDPGELTTGADVSDLETAKPGLIGYRVVDYVIFRVAEMEYGAHSKEAQAAWQLWAATLGEIRDEAADPPGLALRGKNMRRAHPALRGM